MIKTLILLGIILAIAYIINNLVWFLAGLAVIIAIRWAIKR